MPLDYNIQKHIGFRSALPDLPLPDLRTLDINVNNLYYSCMKTHAQYITDEQGKKKAVILDLKEYEKLIRALEDLEDKKAFLSVVQEKSVPYGEIESRLKKSKRR